MANSALTTSWFSSELSDGWYFLGKVGGGGGGKCSLFIRCVSQRRAKVLPAKNVPWPLHCWLAWMGVLPFYPKKALINSWLHSKADNMVHFFFFFCTLKSFIKDKVISFPFLSQSCYQAPKQFYFPMRGKKKQPTQEFRDSSSHLHTSILHAAQNGVLGHKENAMCCNQ